MISSTQTTNLGHLVVKELLTAEAWFDRHDKHHVEFVKDVEELRLDRFGRTDREKQALQPMSRS